jgi:transposase
VRQYGRVESGATISEGERRWLRVLGALNEAQARLFVAERALEMGRGGISRLSKLTGMSRLTIYKGAAELRGKGRLVVAEAGRIRRAGGGRKRVEEVAPGIRRELTRIVEESTAGDPMSLLKWTSKSTRTMAEELTRRGHPVSAVTVGRCLHEMGYSLQANVKMLEGPQHPDRDAQFRYINSEVKSFLHSRDPVISVDTKQKELVGAFAKAGRTWKPQGEPTAVMTHDFPPPREGQGDSLWRLRRGAGSCIGECRDDPRHGRIRRGKHSSLVALAGPKDLSQGLAAVDLC